MAPHSAPGGKRYERCILATCCVPWDEEHRFAEEIFRRTVRGILATGTDHLYIFGTAGEGHAVSDAQFEAITRAFVDEMRQGAPMVGIISTSLVTVLERIEFGSTLGVRDFQVSLPSWGKCSFEEARRFFREVCGRFPDRRFLHYNTVRGGRVIQPEEYGNLAEEFPNLAGTKNTADSLGGVSRLLRGSPQLQHFLTELPFASASLLGLEAGFLISIASTNWRSAKEFYAACTEGDRERIARDISELEEMRVETLALRRDRALMDSAYDKLYHRLSVEDFPLRLLPPYEHFREEEFDAFRRMLEADHRRWMEAS